VTPNAIDLQTMEEIANCRQALRDDDSVRLVVLTGAGEKAFTDRNATSLAHLHASGPDGIGRRGGTPLRLGDRLPPRTAGDLRKPVIAAVDDMACDRAFYLPGGGGVHHLRRARHLLQAAQRLRHVGGAGADAAADAAGKVMRMTLMGSHERLSAHRAREIGLVQEVVPAAEPHQAAPAMRNDAEGILLWAVPSWKEWAEVERDEAAGRSRLLNRAAPLIRDWRCILLAGSPLCPFRTGRLPPCEDRADWSG